MIKLASPDIRAGDIRNAVNTIRSGNLIQGKKVSQLEKQISELSTIPYTAVVSSGTAALHLTLKSLDIGTGDYVIIPAFTFPATANAVENAGGNVILCDVDRKSYVVSPEIIEETLSKNRKKNIKAVMVVQEFGCPVKVKKIMEITRKSGLLLIEDAACALGAVGDGRHPGYYGYAACLSFHPRKGATSGEGGAVLSRHKEVKDKITLLRNHGIMKDAGNIDVAKPGLNYRLTDFQAALLTGQIKRFHGELKKRRVLVNLYCDNLKHEKDISLPENTKGHSWQSFMVVLADHFERERVIKSLLKKGVETSLGAYALNCLSYYRGKYNVDEQSFPVSACLYKQGLVLPLYGKLSADDVNYICDSLRDTLRRL